MEDVLTDTKNNWISVETAKPNPEAPVLIFSIVLEKYKNRCKAESFIDVGWYMPAYDSWVAESIDSDGYSSSRIVEKVTHWQPLPDPPI